MSTEKASLPIAWRLYLPELWSQDRERRKATGVSEEIGFQTKPDIALDQMRAALTWQIPSAPVLADPGYGNDTKFRDGITAAGLQYVVGIQSSSTAWNPGQAPLVKRKWNGIGRPTKLLRRDRQHKPVSARELALGLPPFGLDGSDLAGRHTQTARLAFYGFARPSRISRLLEERALP
jgi:SRSO17 transposase